MAKGERLAGIEARDAVRAAQRENNPVHQYAERVCPECGSTFHVKLGLGQHQKFCKTGNRGNCNALFRARCAARGKTLVPLALAWRVGRGKRDTVSALAHNELITVLDSFAAEDRAAGRPKMDDYVGTMLNSGFRYIDRKRS